MLKRNSIVNFVQPQPSLFNEYLLIYLPQTLPDIMAQCFHCQFYTNRSVNRPKMYEIKTLFLKF